MIYNFIKKIFFLFDEEKTHNFSLSALSYLDKMKILPQKEYSHPIEIMGLKFKNLIGLAAGLDKNGEYIDALSKLGFGFIEIGTVTPKAQIGNPKPRLLRIPKNKSIINRMGFNNLGVDNMINNIKKSKYKGILGINIGKNATTPIENAIEDYIYCLEKVYNYASYITINISSPNTKNLRDLQNTDNLYNLLQKLKQKQNELANKNNKYVPLVLKVAPDLKEEEIKNISQAIIDTKIDGLIATNTTIDKTNINIELKNDLHLGGLSGELLFQKSNDTLTLFKKYLNDKIPIIASGGITSPENSLQKIKLGANAIELYTGLIYYGPNLVKDSFNLIKQTIYKSN